MNNEARTSKTRTAGQIYGNGMLNRVLGYTLETKLFWRKIYVVIMDVFVSIVKLPTG